jgi:RNA polymerase-interacting CarD/CdnL/TRCF family regulator
MFLALSRRLNVGHGKLLLKDVFTFCNFLESAKLQQDLLKVEQLETKITQEMQTLREKIDKMNSELLIYSDLDKLQADAEARKKVWNFQV